MNEEMKKKYEELKKNNKKRNQIYELKKLCEGDGLLHECIESTGGIPLNYDEGNKIMDDIQQKIPFILGRVDFSKFKFKTTINTIDSILEYINNPIDVYVMWDNAKLPCLKSELKDIIKFIDDVTAVSFDTWVVSTDYNVIIEFYHEGEITLGILY